MRKDSPHEQPMSGLMILEIICLCGKKISDTLLGTEKNYLCQESGRGQ